MAPHRRAALWTIASNTGWASAGDRRIMLSTPLVAVCCSSASSRSRASRATSVSRLAVEVMRGCPAFGAIRLLRAAAFGACALGDLAPALERRRIAALGSGQSTNLSLAHPWRGLGMVPTWAFQGLINVTDGCLTSILPCVAHVGLGGNIG